MAIIGAILLAIGIMGGVVAAIPLRMPIEQRANILSAALVVGSAGLSLYLEAVAPTGSEAGSWACWAILTLGAAVLIRVLMVRKLRLNQRDWRNRWRDVMPEGIFKEMLRRYHDVD